MEGREPIEKVTTLKTTRDYPSEKPWRARLDESLNWELRIPWAPGPANAREAWKYDQTGAEHQAHGRKGGRTAAANQKARQPKS